MPHKKAKRLAPDDPILQAVIQRIRELSSDGIAPTLTVYNANRGDLFGDSSLSKRGWSWTALCKLAGLKMNPRAERISAGMAKRSAGRSADIPADIPTGIPPEVEAEIAAAFARGDHLPLHKREWPMQAIPSKIETVIVPRGDGTAHKITRYYASVR